MKAFTKKYNEEVNRSVKALEKMHWENQLCYAFWLSQTWYFVRHSTRLLALAAARCELGEIQLHKRYLEHLKEETGHEFLAQSDLKNLGFMPTDFPEMVETKAFYQCQYNYLFTTGSYHLLGWICYLEGVASKFGAVATKRSRVHGPQATKFIKLHGEEDLKHINSAFKILETFNEQQLNFALESFSESADRYMSILKYAKRLEERISHIA